MKVTLLGTGCPQAHASRYGPASHVRSASTEVLIDCGSGVTQRLVQAGTEGSALEALFLTHLHTDHVIDLYQLIVSSWHQGRPRPHRIYGPRGTKDHVLGAMELWHEERELRIRHERRPSAAGLEVVVEELGSGDEVALPGMNVKAVEVEHPPIEDALGFVVTDSGGRRAAFSGDTRFCPALIQAASGADLLVHECFIHQALEVVPGVRTAEGIEAVASYHTQAADTGIVAARAGVKVLMLNHFVPADFDREAVLNEVAENFDGPVVIGEDLMHFDLDMRILCHGPVSVRLGVQGGGN